MSTKKKVSAYEYLQILRKRNGPVLYPDGRINSAGICISRSKAAWNRGMFALDAFQFEIPEEVLSPCAGAALYRKKLLEEIGLLDVECHNYSTWGRHHFFMILHIRSCF